MTNALKLRTLGWLKSGLLGVAISYAALRVLEYVIPDDPVLILSLEATPGDFARSRYLVGAILFGVIHLMVSARWDLHSKSPTDLKEGKRFWPANTLAIATRIAFAYYYSQFWGGYVSHSWLGRFSLVIGTFGADFTIGLLCLLVMYLVAIYVIIQEPWAYLIRSQAIAREGPWAMFVARIASYAVVGFLAILLSSFYFPFDLIWILLETLLVLLGIWFLIRRNKSSIQELTS